jgi:ferric-dicitrate binding protein FerR (iron transport regulator)
MPGIQPIDRDLLTGLKLGDERALERVFRECYEPLSKKASAALDDEVGVPKVVEGAFVRVWEQRDTIESPEALEAFLFDAVTAGVARERSRRAAAHRMGGDGARAAAHAAAGPMTIDDAWTHVSNVLHTPVHDAHLDPATLQAARHGAAQHVASLAKRPAWQLPTGVAAVLAVTIFGAIRWADVAGADSAINSALASPDARTVSTIAGQLAATSLSDGSKVRLGADTKLRIPPNFGGGTRAVQLDGAGAFTVAPNAKKPFVVRAGPAYVTATGTEFDVRAYPNESAVTVRVRSGTTNVRASGTSRALGAGQSVTLAKDGTMSNPTPGAVDEAFAWTDANFVVNGQPLRAVLPQIVRWYGMDLKVPDQALLTRPVTMRSKLSSSREAIAALESSAHLKFGYEDKAMVLRDAAAKP